jgi:hypothetical protein
MEKPGSYFVQSLENINNEKIKTLISEIAEKLKQDGIIIDYDLRIKEDSFTGCYSQEAIQRDKGFIIAKQKEWNRENTGREIKERTGEKLEILKTILFHKFLGESYIVVRSSKYDDVANGIDNIIIEKKSGNIVCAFDEVCDIKNKCYKEKKEEIMKKNKTGCVLKYGIKKDGDKMLLSDVENLPIFFLALDKATLEGGIANLSPSLEEKTEYEKNLFKYFILSIQAQISLLKNQSLPPAVKNKIVIFEKELEKLKI